MPKTISATFVVLALSAGVYIFFLHGARVVQHAMMLIAPTAERAFSYGQYHFSALTPREYNVEKAEYFFKQAHALDPSLPLVRHELGRIAFLRSNFALAQRYLDEEIALPGTPSPASFYVRALIKGYAGDYMGAAADYEKYFTLTPANWGSINDYAWVLLKADLPEGALHALEWGLSEWPGNPWLLNSKAIALYELGRFDEAAQSAARAKEKVETITTYDWLTAYPGNDPRIAEEGLATFREAVHANYATALHAPAKTEHP